MIKLGDTQYPVGAPLRRSLTARKAAVAQIIRRARRYKGTRAGTGTASADPNPAAVLDLLWIIAYAEAALHDETGGTWGDPSGTPHRVARRLQAEQASRRAQVLTVLGRDQ